MMRLGFVGVCAFLLLSVPCSGHGAVLIFFSYESFEGDADYFATADLILEVDERVEELSREPFGETPRFICRGTGWFAKASEASPPGEFDTEAAATCGAQSRRSAERAALEYCEERLRRSDFGCEIDYSGFDDGNISFLSEYRLVREGPNATYRKGDSDLSDAYVAGHAENRGLQSQPVGAASSSLVSSTVSAETFRQRYIPLSEPPTDVDWIRIRHIGESDAGIPTIYISSKRLRQMDDREYSRLANLSRSEYETVSTAIRGFPAARLNLKMLPNESESSWGTFDVTESANGMKRQLFTVAMPDSCDFMAAIVSNEMTGDFDELREMTVYTSQRLSCASAVAN